MQRLNVIIFMKPHWKCQDYLGIDTLCFIVISLENLEEVACGLCNTYSHFIKIIFTLIVFFFPWTDSRKHNKVRAYLDVATLSLGSRE